MFCPRCGLEARDTDKFCCHCGKSLQPCGTSTLNDRPKKALSFEDFKLQKARDRASTFEPKRKMQFGELMLKKKKDQEVTISTGVMRLADDRSLRRCRGKTLPIKVPVTAKKELILERALRKHANHDKTVIEELKHILLFPDGNPVEKVPGTNTDFVLNKYRDEIGKNYSRLCLFICTKADYTISAMPREEEFEIEMADEVVDDVNDKLDASESAALDNDVTELLMPSFQPSTSGALKDTTNSKMNSEAGHETPSTSKREQMVDCPTCFCLFPIKDIAEHADVCCNDWIGDVQSNHSDGCSENDQMLLGSNNNAGNGADNSAKEEPDLKSIIQNFARSLPERRVRLNIRRKNIWQDVKDIRARGKLASGDNIKIVFIGEPAIDDGGPKREFLAGIKDSQNTFLSFKLYI